ncbi:hypothetical protein GQ53DRAFT_727546 [Thozetella sp. PMI_491]|nr:hypothetical protein GQ53DRAFT_727546 [Thozetella sp. PMI_491]
MASAYTFEKPAVALDQGIYSFIEKFYSISDTPGEHDVYASQFTPDATLVMGSKRVKGTADIRQFRESMWTHVVARKHKVHKVYASSADTPEIMLYGTVDYDLKNGNKAGKEWAGRAVLERSSDDGKWRLSFYQVYLDMAN